MGHRLALVVVAIATSIAAQDVQNGKTVIRMGAVSGLRYEYSKFFVRPGAAVELVFDNKDEMMHNLVITRPKARMKVVMQAVHLGADGAKRNFIPKSADVLWSIPVVEPGSTETLRFTAPKVRGDYPYVCTYPGHGFVMFGTMAVTDAPQPPVRSKPGDNIHALAHGTAMHAGAKDVVMKRMFLPFAGPASIAVSQSRPTDLSFCFDAGACRLRYVWAGGPITRVPLRTAPRLTGPIRYRAGDAFPLRVGSDPKQTAARVRFQGYRVDGKGVPEFEYVVDGVRVFERIVLHADRLERRFRVDTGGRKLWFAFAGERAPGSQPKGRLQKGEGGALSYLGFTAAQAASVTLSIAFDTVAKSGGGR